MNVLDRFSTAGVRFRLDGDRVVAKLNGPIADEVRVAMRALKDEIKLELEAIEARRKHLLSRLAEQPGHQYVVLYDTDTSDKYDVLIVAIPEAMFEVRVPKPADSLDFTCRFTQLMDRYAASSKTGHPL